jgi:hypothetical protein
MGSMAIINQTTNFFQATPNLFQVDWKNSAIDCGNWKFSIDGKRNQKLRFEFCEQCSKSFNFFSKNYGHLMNHGLLSTIDLVIENL